MLSLLYLALFAFVLNIFLAPQPSKVYAFLSTVIRMRAGNFYIPPYHLSL